MLALSRVSCGLKDLCFVEFQILEGILDSFLYEAMWRGETCMARGQEAGSQESLKIPSELN